MKRATGKHRSLADLIRENDPLAPFPEDIRQRYMHFWRAPAAEVCADLQEQEKRLLGLLALVDEQSAQTKRLLALIEEFGQIGRDATAELLRREAGLNSDSARRAKEVKTHIRDRDIEIFASRLFNGNRHISDADVCRQLLDGKNTDNTRTYPEFKTYHGTPLKASGLRPIVARIMAKLRRQRQLR